MVRMKSKIKISGKDAFGWLLICISVLMLCKSLALCFSNDIWYDELFTVGMIEHSYGELIHFTAADVHPPLYYCVTKFFVDLCKLVLPGAGTVIPAKIVSVLPYFVLLLYSVTWIRKRFSIFTGGMFLFCVIAMPQLPAYTVEVRMYGWALLFVTAAFLHAYGCVDRCSRKPYLHGAALVLYGLAAAYTQYFACVAVVRVYFYVLAAFWRQDKRRIKEWCLYVALSIVGYVPWLFALARQISTVRENYWILPLTWRSLGGCVKFLMKPAFTSEPLNVVLAVVMFAGYVEVVGGSLIRYRIGSKRSREIENAGHAEILKEAEKVYHNGRVLHGAAGLAVLVGVVLFGFAASFLIRPVFVYRYMLPAMGCFWLSFAIGLDDILCKLNLKVLFFKKENRGKWYAWIRCLSVVFILFYIIVGLRDYRAFLGEEEYKIRLMKETEAALSEIGPEDIVIYNFDQVQAVTSYYLEDTTKRYLWNGTAESLIQEIIGPCKTLEESETIKSWLAKRMEEEELADAQVWFIGSFNSREDIVAEWRKDGLTVEEKGSYLLERYWFNLYKIS